MSQNLLTSFLMESIFFFDCLSTKQKIEMLFSLIYLPVHLLNLEPIFDRLCLIVLEKLYAFNN